jgi:hypothetical protein
MARQPISGGKKKSVGGYQAAAERQMIGTYARTVAGNSRNANTAKRVSDASFKKFGDYLAATDINGRGRSVESARRKKQLDSYVKAAGAAGVASGYGTTGKTPSTRAGSQTRRYTPYTSKKSLPKTK